MDGRSHGGCQSVRGSLPQHGEDLINSAGRWAKFDVRNLVPGMSEITLHAQKDVAGAGGLVFGGLEFKTQDVVDTCDARVRAGVELGTEFEIRSAEVVKIVLLRNCEEMTRDLRA